MSRRLAAYVLIAGLAVAAAAAAPAQETPPDLLLVLDASGSMWGQIEGENKIVIARRVLRELIDELPGGSRVGLVAYGHRREGDCDDIETVTPLAALDRETLKGTVEALNPKGKTPITGSVRQAFAELEGHDAPATVLLVSDGLETCGGDPCDAVRAARAVGIDFVMHVVGFDVAGEDTSQLECMAQAGDGLFLGADSAEELSAALDQAVAAPVEVPDGRLSVKTVADGELTDAVVTVASARGEEVAAGRTYAGPDTNPRVLPLADGVYRVEVAPVGLRGATPRRFEIEIRDGGTVEKELDFSAGELAVKVTRNGELGDAVVRVYTAGTETQVASGRTYTSPQSNPVVLRLVAGEYDVELGSVEIAGKPGHRFTGLVVEGRSRVERSHEFTSGGLSVRAERSGELVDAVVAVRDAASGKAVAQGRTYTSASSNPKRFVLEPGEYAVEVREIRGETREAAASVGAGESVDLVVDLDAG